MMKKREREGKKKSRKDGEKRRVLLICPMVARFFVVDLLSRGKGPDSLFVLFCLAQGERERERERVTEGGRDTAEAVYKRYTCAYVEVGAKEGARVRSREE